LKWDTADWVILGLVSAAWVIATVYLFRYHSEPNFVTWSGFSATIVSAYHWLRIRDSKQADAQ
jgi:hypothetical protein